LRQLSVANFGQEKIAASHPRTYDRRFRLWGATPALVVCHNCHRRMPLLGWIMLLF
jgi:hypothetical protein